MSHSESSGNNSTCEDSGTISDWRYAVRKTPPRWSHCFSKECIKCHDWLLATTTKRKRNGRNYDISTGKLPFEWSRISFDTENCSLGSTRFSCSDHWEPQKELRRPRDTRPLKYIKQVIKLKTIFSRLSASQGPGAELFHFFLSTSPPSLPTALSFN